MVMSLLRDVLHEHMQKLLMFLKHNGLDYDRCELTLTVCSILKDDNNLVKELLINDIDQKHLKPSNTSGACEWAV